MISASYPAIWLKFKNLMSYPVVRAEVVNLSEPWMYIKWLIVLQALLGIGINKYSFDL